MNLFRCTLLDPAARSPAASVRAEESFAKVSEKVNPKLVKLFGSGGIRGLASYGTGVFVSPDGYILTVNSHILDTQRPARPPLRRHALPRQGRGHRAGAGHGPGEDRRRQEQDRTAGILRRRQAAKRRRSSRAPASWRSATSSRSPPVTSRCRCSAASSPPTRSCTAASAFSRRPTGRCVRRRRHHQQPRRGRRRHDDAQGRAARPDRQGTPQRADQHLDQLRHPHQRPHHGAAGRRQEA